MRVHVITFGAIAEVLGTKRLEIEATDTQELQDLLTARFPELRGKMYAIAVDRQIISKTTPLSDNAEVALLPPFSGG